MGSISKLFIFVAALFALTTNAYAQSAREEFKQLIAQLKEAPNDNALREKIIKRARTLKPEPALPDAAIAFEGRAQFAFKSAKSENDFVMAAREYEKAVAAAPWVLGYYADLCTIYEKAGRLEDAKRHCGFYLMGLNDPAQMIDVKRRIAGLEYGIERAKSPQARETASVTKVNCPWQYDGGSTTIAVDYGSNSLTYVENYADGRDTPVIVSRANITETNISWTQTEAWADRSLHVVSYNLSRISGELNFSYSDSNGRPKTGRRTCVTAKQRF